MTANLAERTRAHRQRIPAGETVALCEVASASEAILLVREA